jgi:GT2 family glycosyltransferase
MPRVSIVIPTWNAADLLSAALRSLRGQQYRNFEILVVDNGSTDRTVGMLQSEHPTVRLIRFDENRGFAAATNAGIAAAHGEIIVLMNNDTEADVLWLRALVDALDRHPEVGSCASKMLMFHERNTIDSAGDQLGIFASQIGHGMPDGLEFAKPRYVLSACGGAAAYRRSMLEEIGVMDERFFAYFEDLDLGVRARFAGYRCLYVPEAVIYHHGSVTANKLPARKFYLLMRNSLFIFFQYMPFRRLALWGSAVLVWPVIRSRMEGQPLRLGVKCVMDFLKDLPSVLHRRRQVRKTRKISWAEFRATLAGPLVRQPRGPRLSTSTHVPAKTAPQQ